MNIKFYSYLNKISNHGILLPVFILFSGVILLPDNMNTIKFVIGELLLILFFYRTFSNNSRRWSNLSSGQFISRVFILSIVVRFLSILVVLILQKYAFKGYEVFIHPDSWNYNIGAEQYAKELSIGISNAFASLNDLAFDDKGYPIVLGTIYSIFGAIPFVGKMLNMILGSFSVILIYKLTRIIYNENIARTAAIITAIFPYFLFYNAVILKEIIMIYFLLLAVYYFYRCIYVKGSFTNYLIMALAIISLMFFRLVLGALIIAVFASYLFLFLGSKGRLSIKILTTSVFLISAVFLLTMMIPEIVDKTKSYYEQRTSQIEGEVSDLGKNEQIQKSYEKAELAPMMIAAALFAPYPSFAKVAGKEFNNINFAGALIKLNLMFFYYYGLYWTFMNLRQRGYVIYAFAIGYISVIAIAGSILQHRFQLPANPFQIMIASAGIHNMTPRFFKLWKPYLVFCFLITLAYNLFKLNIRGM